MIGVLYLLVLSVFSMPGVLGVLCVLDVLVVLGVASRVCKSDPGQWTVPPPSRQLGNLAALCSFDQLIFNTLDISKTAMIP